MVELVRKGVLEAMMVWRLISEHVFGFPATGARVFHQHILRVLHERESSPLTV